MSEQLKPCQCQSSKLFDTAVYYRHTGADRPNLPANNKPYATWMVKCKKCGITILSLRNGSDSDKKVAHEKWNHRPEIDALNKRIAELETMLFEALEESGIGEICGDLKDRITALKGGA